jgi:hypothetical protein
MNEKLLDMIIRTRVGDFDFEVRINNLSEIENAYLSLLDARREFKEIQEKHKMLILIDSTKDAASPYWVITSESQRKIESDDKAKSILLSLLDSYPEPKLVKTIVFETEIPKSTISDYLNGVTGDVGTCFEKVKGGWKLTHEGLYSIAKILKTIDEPDE